MKFKTLSLSTLLFFCIHLSLKAQDKSPVKFGKVSAEDFDLNQYKFNQNANAVVIADIGSSGFEGNSKGWFSLIYKHQKRIKILNKNGFDAASIEIPLYSDGPEEEKIINLKATTYNLESGQVIKTELESSAIFKDKLSKNVITKKFTFPAVKEGSIIEYSYTINSDFLFNLQPWIFQDNYPHIWSEYQVDLPDFFGYVSLSQGYHPYFINSHTNTNEIFNVIFPGGTSTDERASINESVTKFRWVMKDVPEIKEEPFTTTLNIHTAKIEFQLSQYRFPDMPVKDIMGNWMIVSEKMLQRDDFGSTLYSSNNWLDNEMKSIIRNQANSIDEAKQIYMYVRDNFTCTNYNNLFLTTSLKNVFKNKNGSVGDINLLLIAMLNHENIKTVPVILSTREHGYAQDLYPLMDRYNYVIAKVKTNDSEFYLDASHPTLGFGKLPLNCYNGYGRIIDKIPNVSDFNSDSLKEEKITTVFVSNNDKGETEGSFQTIPGYYESTKIRSLIKEKGQANFFKTLSAAYGTDVEIKDPYIDSLKNLEKPIAIHYDLKFNNTGQDIIYFNPMLGEGYKDNFLKASERKYPVEMPYTFDETYILNMDTPANYIIDDLPKSAKVSYNGGEGSFEYLIGKTDTGIQLRSRVVMNKANFLPEEYNSLRDFFSYIVKKHNEQIVFKKKK